MKQIQDAYIVAATRTPIGRSHRGYFRNTRPDDKRPCQRASAYTHSAVQIHPTSVPHSTCSAPDSTPRSTRRVSPAPSSDAPKRKISANITSE